MADPISFPDAEHMLIDLLDDLAETVSTEFPADPPDTLRASTRIRVVRHGGSDDRITDTARVTIDVLASTKETASVVARQVQQRLLSAPHRTAYGVIDRVTTDLAPVAVPYVDSPPPHRYVARYAVRARRT